MHLNIDISIIKKHKNIHLNIIAPKPYDLIVRPQALDAAKACKLFASPPYPKSYKPCKPYKPATLNHTLNPKSELTGSIAGVCPDSGLLKVFPQGRPR